MKYWLKALMKWMLNLRSKIFQPTVTPEKRSKQASEQKGLLFKVLKLLMDGSKKKSVNFISNLCCFDNFSNFSLVPRCIFLQQRSVERIIVFFLLFFNIVFVVSELKKSRMTIALHDIKIERSVGTRTTLRIFVIDRSYIKVKQIQTFGLFRIFEF